MCFSEPPHDPDPETVVPCEMLVHVSSPRDINRFSQLKLFICERHLQNPCSITTVGSSITSGSILHLVFSSSWKRKRNRNSVKSQQTIPAAVDCQRTMLKYYKNLREHQLGDLWAFSLAFVQFKIVHVTNFD